MDRRIDAAREIIESEHQKPLTVKEVTARVGVSRSHFTLLFKKETGVTFKAYLREARLSKAAELLSTDHLSIKQVAYSVGYSHTSSFARDFKRRFGKTPVEYCSASKAVRVASVASGYLPIANPVNSNRDLERASSLALLKAAASCRTPH
ncbi:MAG TPA: AraC family transcriptional regulator [Terriglobia bacterium]|nr:AraC family transcriptional regulator [Terriglobia bacterium]